MGSSSRRVFWLRSLRTAAVALGFVLVVSLLMLWLMGALRPKIAATAVPAGERLATGWDLASVRKLRLPATESASGSIRPVREALVAAKLLARVVEVNVKAGQPVQAGEILVRLDDVDLRARLEQAQAQLRAAQATRDQARIDLKRIQSLREAGAATVNELDRAATNARTSEAEVQAAEQAVRMAQTVLDYATIAAPMTGIVVDKRINAGDTVTPGQGLLMLYDPTSMQMVASVRESLAQRLKVGEAIAVRIDALDKTCQGHISEIVPEAQAASRSFQVKVTGPCQPGVYAGMFGRLSIPVGEDEVLAIPAAAVRRIGQLDIVEVAQPRATGPAALERRAVQLGRGLDGGKFVQVLAGLREGEQVAVAPGTSPASGGVQ